MSSGFTSCLNYIEATVVLVLVVVVVVALVVIAVSCVELFVEP